MGCFPFPQSDLSWTSRVLYIMHYFPQYPASVRSYGTEVRSVRQINSLSKWNDKFRSDRSKWTTSRDGMKYSGRKEPKRTFSFDVRPKFPNILGEWKSPLVLSQGLS